jgi:N-acetyl-alpha-D-glucosaminyl L-malate synthase BshA
MDFRRHLKIGLACYPSVGGSGILATSLGEELARRGHEVHFLSYERPFRLSIEAPRIHFHQVPVNHYGLFKYPDYTLPLSVKMAEVCREHALDVLHVHYAVPHTTAAILARSMLPAEQRPKIVTTLHGTDITLLGHDAAYAPAIGYALRQCDAVTAVSAYLKEEAQRLLGNDFAIEIVHNFFTPRPPTRLHDEVRCELGVAPDEVLLLHSSNLRAVKRIDLLLAAVARVRSAQNFKLVILAGDSFSSFEAEVRRLGLQQRIVVRERVQHIEDYVQAADIALVSSQSESFCLFLLEAMRFGCPTIATRVGGIPEVVSDGETGFLVPFGDADSFARQIENLMESAPRRAALGRAGQAVAEEKFSAAAIVPRYETLYQRLLNL